MLFSWGSPGKNAPGEFHVPALVALVVLASLTVSCSQADIDADTEAGRLARYLI